ncbi:MAG: hypothetical protein QOC56_1785 [Alphaproteobacteria bacterium]|nr:hypothetical protein [Alphaproteobacteria bacterium]
MTNRLEPNLGRSPVTSTPGRAGTTTPLRMALAAGVAVAFLASLAGPADAASRSKRQAEAAKTAKASTKKGDDKGPFGELPKGPLQMVVSIQQQHVTLYANGKRIAQAPVSTGTAAKPTPMGVFSVIEKDRFHHSNLYGNAPMYYMHRLTWSGVAMHEGVLPGVPASHGCIRMPTAFVSKLWLITKLGVRVVVARHDVEPHEFEHAKLFHPKPKPTENPVSDLRPLDGLRPTFATLGNSTVGFGGERPLLRLAQATVAETDAVKTPDTGTQLPVTARENPTADAPMFVSPKVVPIESLRGSSPGQTIEPKIEAADAPKPVEVETTASTPAPAAAEAPKAAAPAAAPRVPAIAEAPKAPEPEKPAPTATEPAKPAPPKNRTAEPVKRNGQVAVFISKKEKKIFVRQGFVPVFDMPIEITNPDVPLGTHVYTAMEVLDGARMRWNVITMPAEQPRPATTSSRDTKRGKKNEPPPKPVVETRPASNAMQALDRVQMPPEAAERISELLIPGSSLIISDQGLGNETGRYTEFIVLTR